MRTTTSGLLVLAFVAALTPMSVQARPVPAPGEIVFARELALGEFRSSGTQAVAVADFDGDGLLDLASVGMTTMTSILKVHLNDIDHGFTRIVSTPGGQSDQPLVAGDFNEDGHTDLMNGISIFRGLGDGSFAAPETLITDRLQWSSEPVAADLDGDGHLDVAVSCEPDTGGASILAVLWGHGDGTFEPRQDLADLSQAFALHLAADVTEDGRLDLIGGIWASGDVLDPSDTLIVFPHLGGRAYGPAVQTVTDGQTDALAIADLDRDGHVDLVMNDRVQYGDGTGSFESAPRMLPGVGLAGGSNSLVGVATTDLDHDGWTDILTRDGDAVVVHRNLGGLGFETVGAYRSLGYAYHRRGLVIADLDADGHSDVITFPHVSWFVTVSGSPQQHSGMAVFFGRPDATLVGTTYCEPFGPMDSRNQGHSTAIRLRADGMADIVHQTYPDTLYLLRNLGERGFGSPSLLGPGRLTALMDIDRDGLDDLVSQAGTALEVRLGDPVLGLGSPNVVGTYSALAVGDVDGGLGVDLVVREPPGTVSLMSGDGLGGFGPPFPLGVTTSFLDAYSCRSVIGDLDADGLDDLLVANHVYGVGDSLRVFRSNGHAPMQAVQSLAFQTDFETWTTGIGHLSIADLDRDGDLDLLVFHYLTEATGGFHVLLNDGSGRLQYLGWNRVGTDVRGSVVGDLDGDGVLDVVSSWSWDGATGVLTLFKGQGDGTFTSQLDAPEPYGPMGALALGRFDADERLDIAVPTSMPNAMLVLHNISTPGEVTPVTASLVSASIEDGFARVTWSTGAQPGIEALVFRSVDGAAFAEVARLHPDGDGRVRYEDASVAPGHRYGYRLAFAEGGQLVTVSETWLEMPLAASLALAGATPNPVAGDLTVAFSLARRGPGTLGLFDLAGRRVAEHDLAGFAPGAHRVRLASKASVAPGLYFIRLVTPERTLVARAIVMR